MNYSFEYIDIILLAMIAGFIFLRLRGILGKRSGFDGKPPPQFQEVLKNMQSDIKENEKAEFDEKAQNEFLNGAKIAYETIITDFSDQDNKLVASKPLLSRDIYDQFNNALKERNKKGLFAEIFQRLRLKLTTYLGMAFLKPDEVIVEEMRPEIRSLHPQQDLCVMKFWSFWDSLPKKSI